MQTPIKSPSPTKEKKDKDGDAKRLARCGKCTNCKSTDCGACYNCYDKPKFGGPGIKKQACINRKCLVMVPRDEDGEKLARKRAKQRAVVPIVAPLGAIPSALGGDPTAFLSGLPSGLNIQVPSMAPMIMVPSSPSVDSSCALGSPRSGLSSPATPEGTPSRAIVDASSLCSASSVSLKQQWSEQSLFALALDDEPRPGTALSSAMLFAAIQAPPTATPPRHPPSRSKPRHHPASPEGAPESAQYDAVSPPETPTRRPKRSAAAAAAAARADADDDEDEELRAAFAAHIRTKLELDAPPPAQLRLDDLQEEFLLLNAEHRSTAAFTAIPILAF